MAELTSLEELVRTMSADDQASSPNCGKFTVSLRALSRVHAEKSQGSAKPVPKEQRRGAMIILGMLATAKRHMVDERVDTLLEVGLGTRGAWKGRWPGWLMWTTRHGTQSSPETKETCRSRHS